MRAQHAALAAGVFVMATLLCAALVPPTRRVALALGVIDRPGTRKIHSADMARMGGVAVFVSFTAIVLGGYFAVPVLAASAAVREWLGSPFGLLQEARAVEGRLLGVLAGALIAFVVGLVDDVLGERFPVWLKALGQLAAAGTLVAAGVRTSFLPTEELNVAVTMLWLVGITNAFNLLDNMDGLAAGVALVACTVLLINAWSLGEYFISLILLAFMGSLLGFLFFNFNPASIFLGDCGSLFIGYMMGSLTLLERYVSHASSSLFAVLMPVVVLAVPLLDTGTVIFIRLRERRPFYVGDRRHLSHRLVDIGFTSRAAVLVIYLVTFSVGLGAVSLADATPGQSAIILVQSLCFVALILVFMFTDRGEAKAGPGG